MRRSLAFALAIVLFGACSTKEIDMKTPVQDDEMFYASFEQPVDNDTKVYANEDMLLRWTADDRVSIFNKLTYNQEYMFTGQTGANAGGFRKVDNDEFVTGNAIAHVVSVYPYQEATTITEKEELSVTLPSEQFYAEHTFGLGSNTMVSVSEDNVLQFKAVGGYLVFKLYGAGVSVSSVTLKGNNDEPLAGQAAIATSLFEEPSLAMDEGNSSTMLTLTCTSPVALGTTAEDYTEFWFVLPPTSFTKGFTIVVTGPDGGTYEKSTDKPITIERNKLARMAAIEVILSGASVPPDNEIWYTSIDGCVVSMNDNYLSEFGANLVSNTYENEKGVFVFDGDITAVASYAFNQSIKLKTIALPESVTVIGDGAFQSCKNLEHIYLPDSITTIGSAAFNNCQNLGNVILPKNLVTIEEAGFSNCSSITSIILPDGFAVMDSRWSHNVFGGCSSLEHFGGKFASEDGRCIIMNHVVRSFAPAGLTTYKVPVGVEEIGGAAFEDSKLTSLEVPESLTSIGDYAFMNCTALSSFTIPTGVRHLGKSAFSHCTSLPRITLPDRLEDIGVTVFMNCRSLESIQGPFTTVDGRYLIKDNVLLAVASKGMSSFIVPEGVESISESVFMFLPEVVSVSIPQSVTRIGHTVFRYCDNLASVVIRAQNPPTASYRMFEGADRCSIYVPATSVEAYKTAQYWSDYSDRIFPIEAIQPNNEIWYKSSTGAVIEPSVTEGFGANLISNTYVDGKGILRFDGDVLRIPENTFKNNRRLREITLPNSVQVLESMAFGYTELSSVTIPNSVTDIVGNPFYRCLWLLSFHGKFASEDHLSLIVGNRLAAFAVGTEKKSYTIPDGVEIIGTYAFEEARLDELIIPEGVLILEDNAFNACSLPKLTLPNSLITIGDYALSSCIYLTSITIPDSVETVGVNPFFFSTRLASFYGKYATSDHRCLIKGDKLISCASSGESPYDIPEGVKTIGTRAFTYAECMRITIPSSVTTIEDFVFQGCENLESITLPRELSKIGWYAFYDCTNLSSIRVLAEIPPDLSPNHVFDNTNDCPIYVPAASVETYKTTGSWRGYADRIFPIETSTGGGSEGIGYENWN